MTANHVKHSLSSIISEFSKTSWLFLRDPAKDFTRKRKLCFQDVVFLLLSMEAKSTPNELIDYFKCAADMPTPSALRQQRDKILPEAFEFLFREFAGMRDDTALYRGYRMLAVDGSDLAIAPDPSDSDSYYPGTVGKKHYGLLHLNAFYDLQLKTYVDALVQKSRKANEQRALCDMVDRSDFQNAIVIADRGYEGYNALAHIQEKGWKFLFRIKDNACGIAAGLTLPDSDTFDVSFSLKLSNKLTTVITNLDYPPDELMRLYAMRWGIETSFRDLKYTIGLSAFHSKKVEHILQEIFARLTMYNFAEHVIACMVIQRGNKKYAYQVNFSAAVHICREFLRGNVHPPDVEALLARFISPVRPDRKQMRKLAPKGFVGFLYRVA